MNWIGVMPAITTCFDQKYDVDHEFMAGHCQWLINNGCTGIVAVGSLGEGATLSTPEKLAILRNCQRALNARAPLIAAISALSTAEAVTLAKSAAEIGCDGLMVLPPYLYKGDWREMKAYLAAVFEATPLSCMLYNNPIAYGSDFTPEQVVELAAEHENFHSVKESSTDVRRVAAIRALLSHRLELLVGVDDAIVEAIGVGASGWIAGLANAFPRESVALFNLTVEGERDRAFELYRWFLPLLRFDTVIKFVQLIKLVQAAVGMGNARVRPPRLEIVGHELEKTMQILEHALANRPLEYATPALHPTQ